MIFLYRPTVKVVPYKRIKYSTQPVQSPAKNEELSNQAENDTESSDKVLQEEKEDVCITEASSAPESDAKATENEGNGGDADSTTEEASIKLKIISMGSPIPINPQKPPLENFAKDMGELMYFENLPSSTGKFDKMRGLLQKVREKITADL